MTHGITRRRIVALAATACLLCCSAAQAKGPSKPGGGGGDGGSTALYIIISFAPDGVQLDSSSVFGLNAAGDVVGVVETGDGQDSYHLDLDTGTYTLLPGRVWAVNNLGEIVGTVSGDPATDGYYLSAPDAEPTLLPPLPGDLWVDVYSINDSRIIVGDSVGTTGVTAVIWRPILNEEDGKWSVDGPVPLLPLDGDTFSTATDINDPIAGGPFEVLGDSGEGVIWTIDLNPDGTLTAPSDPMSLGTLDGSPFNGFANNSLGDVCGKAGTTPAIKAYDASAQPLNVVRDTSWGRAMDINDVGQMVGQIETVSKSNSYRVSAYLWEGVNADPVNLEKLIDKNSGWDLTYADQINNDGVIGGSGYYNGMPTGFIMIPAP